MSGLIIPKNYTPFIDYAGVVNHPFLLSGSFQSEQSVQARTESYFENTRLESGGCFKPHINEDMLRFGAGSFYRMVMLIQFRYE